MQAKTLRKAIVEAERFIESAKNVEIKDVSGTGMMKGKHWEAVVEYTKECASCKRSSMDLTRVLADLRNGK